MSFEIDIDNRQHALAIDEPRLQKAILVTLHQELVESAVLSISLVDDPTIHQLNRKHLQHDYPTDVISFQLEHLVVSEQPNGTDQGKPSAGCHIEGEIVVSADTAIRMAAEAGWSANDEVMLYVVHGLLHLCGYDDLEPDLKITMRERERSVLAELQLTPIYPQDEPADS